jgi:hypothetical protein
MRVYAALAAAAAAVGLAAAPALAQDYSLDPNFGTYEMVSPFDPDPFILNDIIAGGSVRVYETIEGCNGHVSEAPDLRVNFVAGSGLPLTFAVVSTEGYDTTLLINGPDGTWYCNDDVGGDDSSLVLNSGLTFNNPQSGQYDVWVGTFGEGENFPVVFAVTESVTDGSGPQAENSIGTAYEAGQAPQVYDDSSSYASQGIELWAGFEPDPYRAQVLAGGPVSASEVNDQCVGFIPEYAQFELSYQAGTDFPLIISVASMADTTLMIAAPNGQVYCDDDGGNAGLNPSVVFSAPMSGVYAIYVGSFSGDVQPATLNISELYSE